MSDRPLRIAVVGGLGKMASPMATHLAKAPDVEVVYVFDRGTRSPSRDASRTAWKSYGALLTDNHKDLTDPSLDGIFLCCGKNGEDLPLIAGLAAKAPKRDFFLCHLSTVSTAFVRAADEFCTARGVDYVNYPLTGGVTGALSARMLILCSGRRPTYDRLSPVLNRLGQPRYFGSRIDSGARAKFMGHLMVFNGLMGILSAAALYQAAPPEEGDIVDFFDYLNQGAGGTRQWDLVLRKGLAEGIWDSPFSVRHAAIDALYTAGLALESKISQSAAWAALEVAGLLCFVASRRSPDLATHATIKDFGPDACSELDIWMADLHRSPRSADAFLERCIASLPASLAATVQIGVTKSDFERAAATPS